MNQSKVRYRFLVLPFFILTAFTACSPIEKTQKPAPKNEFQINISKEAPRAMPPRVDSILQYSTSVRQIFEDSKGNIWFGTHQEGACKYDGKNFSYFTIEQGLVANQIRSIQEDKKGNIWFGTDKGICCYNGKSIRNITADDFRLPSTIKSEGPSQIFLDDFWFGGGTENGAYRHNRGKFEYFPFPIPATDTLSKKTPYNLYQVFSLHQDRSNILWFGTVSMGVIRYDGQSFTYINEKGLDLAVRSIFQDSKGDIWFGNNGGGLFKYDFEAPQEKRLRNIAQEKQLDKAFIQTNSKEEEGAGSMSRIWAIAEDKFDNLWFGTADSGVWYYDRKFPIENKKALKNFTIKDGLSSNFVDFIYTDKKGKLWFGLDDGNVFRFDGKTFNQFGI